MKEELKKICLIENEKAFQSLEILEKYPQKIVLITNKNHKLVGTLTDGDIRRGLINGLTLKDPLRKFMNTNFEFIYSTNDKEKCLKKYANNSNIKIPILNKNGSIIDLISTKKALNNTVSTPVVIMAGGLGKRLRPYTNNLPKPMLKIDNKPILEIIINNFKTLGFVNFYISVNYLKEHIINYFKDGKDHGVNISYIKEKKPLGTAGSLKYLQDKIDQSFIILNGDVLSKFNPIELINFHEINSADATICVRDHETVVPYGVITNKGIFLDQFKEKPVYRNKINAGIYILKPSLLEMLKKDSYLDMPELLMMAKNSKKVALFPLHEYWLDIGVPKTLQSAIKTWKVSEDK